MKEQIIQQQDQSNFRLGDLVKIVKSPYEGIQYTDGIIVSFSKTGLAEIICSVNGKNMLLPFYDDEIQDDNVNPNSFKAQGYPPY